MVKLGDDELRASDTVSPTVTRRGERPEMISGLFFCIGISEQPDVKFKTHYSICGYRFIFDMSMLLFRYNVT